MLHSVGDYMLSLGDKCILDIWKVEQQNWKMILHVSTMIIKRTEDTVYLQPHLYPS